MRHPKPLLLTLLALLLGITAVPVFSQRCFDCQISQAREQQANQRLQLTAAQRATAEAMHLLGGLPVPPPGATNEHLIHQHEWVTWYDDDLRVPLWVSYQLTRADASAQRTRRDCFRRDPRLPLEASSVCEDYQEPIFDRGHVVPRADMNRSQTAMDNTFIFSNMAPQHDTFNQGIWARLEDKVRSWAIVADGVFIITGAVFDKDGDRTRDADDAADRVAPRGRVAVPTHFYKIVLHRRPSGFIDTISILLPHRDEDVFNTNQHLRSHIVSIDEIESLTGIDFLPGLPDQREEAVERFVAPALWNTQ